MKWRRSPIALSGAVALLTAGRSNGPSSFQPSVDSLCGANPSDAAVADFDDDGWLDVTVTLASPARHVVLRGLSNGPLAPVQSLDLPGASAPADLAAADFDSDGRRDLALVSSGADEVWALRNDGSGVFVPLTVLTAPSASHPEGLVAGDFGGNGSEDLAACVSGVGATHPTDIVTSDFDLDTRLGFALLSSDLSRVSALRRLEGGL